MKVFFGRGVGLEPLRQMLLDRGDCSVFVSVNAAWGWGSREAWVEVVPETSKGGEWRAELDLTVTEAEAALLFDVVLKGEPVSAEAFAAPCASS